MPEGHTLHRLAAALDGQFAGQRLGCSSPQGRFAASAELIDDTVLLAAEAWGKHLFLDFEGGHVVHVHLGLYGRFDLSVGEAPPPVGQVRLRLVSMTPPSYADLRGATACELLTDAHRRLVIARLGPDPLRKDADPEIAWRRISRSRAPIGALLMDQTVLAGVGNVYRAEVLYRHRMHPLRPGRSLRRSQFQAMWDDLVELMEDGVRVGHIDTVRPEHSPENTGRPPPANGRRAEVYVYRRHGQPCLVCKGPVATDVLVGRNLFWCPRCQPAFRSRARR